MKRKLIYLSICALICGLIVLNLSINLQTNAISNIGLANTEAIASGGEGGSGSTVYDHKQRAERSCAYTIPTIDGEETIYGTFYTCEKYENKVCFDGCFYLKTIEL